MPLDCYERSISPPPISNREHLFLYLKDEIHKLAKITVFSPLDFSISENEITNASKFLKNGNSQDMI